MKRLLAAATIAAATATSASAATFTVYTDRTAYENALLGLTIYDFNSGAPGSGVTITGDDVTFSGGVMNDVIDQGSNVDTVFAFSSGIVAFGGDFDLFNPGGPGTGIEVQTANGGTYTVGEIANTTAGFWGFISDELFTTVNFMEGSGCCVETYTLENLTTGAAVVPLPAGLPLLLGGLFVLGGIGAARRRRTAAA